MWKKLGYHGDFVNTKKTRQPEEQGQQVHATALDQMYRSCERNGKE